jgi:hypothetical protein
VEGAELREEYSDDRVRLARLAHWRSVDDVVDLSSLESLKDAYEMGAGVVWMHWDVSAVGLEPGDPDRRRLGDAEFLSRILKDAFAPRDGDPISQIIKWRLNVVGTLAFGGLTSFEDKDEDGAVCMFDSEVFDIVYSFPSWVKAEMFRESWRRVVLQRHRVAGIAVPSLVITIRNDGDPVYFDEEIRRESEHEGDENELLSPPWIWSDAALTKGLSRRLRSSKLALRSGDFLAAVGRECVEAYEEPRSWLLAETEDIEVARLAPDLTEGEIDQIAFARRHAWLLRQASRVRAALDWSRTDHELPAELFSDEEIQLETVERRHELLAALTEVRGNLRSALDLVATASTAEQLELTRDEAARSNAFQSAITFVAAVLLAPGLVAAIFGAMPSVLEDCPSWRFVAIVASMVLAGGFAALMLRSISRPPGRRGYGS